MKLSLALEGGDMGARETGSAGGDAVMGTADESAADRCEGESWVVAARGLTVGAFEAKGS